MRFLALCLAALLSIGGAHGALLSTQTLHFNTVAAMKALATTTLANGDTALVTETGKGGVFYWNSSSLAGTVVTDTDTSSSVSSGTETATFGVAHGIKEGYPLIVSATVDGLTSNTIYYAIVPSTTTLKFATSLENSHQGTAVDLTATTNVAVKTLLDPLQAVYLIAAPGGTSQARDCSAGCWVRSDVKRLDVRWFGAVGDGVYDAGISGYNGTDNVAPFQAAFDYGGSLNIPIYAPAGNYRMARLTAGYTNRGYLFINQQHTSVSGDGMDSTRILIDEDVTRITASMDFIRTNPFSNQSITPPEPKDTLAFFGLYDLSIRGLWTQHPADSSEPDRINGIATRGVSRMEMKGVGLFDIVGKGLRSRFSQSVLIENCVFERITSTPLTTYDFENYIVNASRFAWSDDDFFEASDAGNYPPRANVVFTNNTVLDTEGSDLLGAKNVTIANNTFQRTHSGNMLSVSGFVNTTQLGEGSTFNVAITGNTISDPFNRAIADGSALATSTGLSGAITISVSKNTAGTSAVAPGRFDSGSGLFIDPQGLDSNSRPYSWNYDSVTQSEMGGQNVTITGNTIIRTLGPTSNYSDYGFGEMFHYTGWIDPAVTSSNYVDHGIVLVSDLWGASITGNTISGFRGGAGVFMYYSTTSSSNYYAFKDLTFSGNVFRDCFRGIDQSVSGGVNTDYYPVNGIVSNNIFNLDPYHVQPTRKSPIDGSWTSTAAVGDQVAGVAFRATTGWLLTGNTFKNLYTPVLANSNADDNAQMAYNLVYSQPASDAFSTSNKGVAIPQPAGAGFPAFIQHIIDSDPTSATYEHYITSPDLTAAAIPGSGTFLIGHRINNSYATANWPAFWQRTATGTSTTAWIPVPQGGQQSIGTDAAFALNPLSDPVFTKHTGTLTADRAVTLNGGWVGSRLIISRTGAGAFNLNVGTGPLCALATNKWCEVAYDGTNWYKAEAGDL